ncbi:MAG: acyl-CoA thioesterase [Mariprofundaceae bacterium]
MSRMDAKAMSEALVEVCTQVREDDLNHYGSIHGGRLFTLADDVGFLAAHEHAGTKCVTIAAHRAHFSHPLLLGAKLFLSAQVALVGRSSIWVNVQISADVQDQGAFTPVMHVVIVYVAVDEHNRPIRVAQAVAHSSEEEKLQRRMKLLRRQVRETA